jgi:hypothetical protein
MPSSSSGSTVVSSRSSTAPLLRTMNGANGSASSAPSRASTSTAGRQPSQVVQLPRLADHHSRRGRTKQNLVLRRGDRPFHDPCNPGGNELRAVDHRPRRPLLSVRRAAVQHPDDQQHGRWRPRPRRVTGAVPVEVAGQRRPRSPMRLPAALRLRGMQPRSPCSTRRHWRDPAERW